jgi:hypothetical protein
MSYNIKFFAFSKLGSLDWEKVSSFSLSHCLKLLSFFPFFLLMLKFPQTASQFLFFHGGKATEKA